MHRYICVGLPVFSRDLLFHAFGADCMHEHGKVVILGKSVDAHPSKEVPWKATGWLHKRMSIQDIEAIVEAISPTAAKVCLQKNALFVLFFVVCSLCYMFRIRSSLHVL